MRRDGVVIYHAEKNLPEAIGVCDKKITLLEAHYLGIDF